MPNLLGFYHFGPTSSKVCKIQQYGLVNSLREDMSNIAPSRACRHQPPVLIVFFGKDSITVGSQMENFGNMADPQKQVFLSRFNRYTAPEFISLPVAGKVNTVPNGPHFPD
jgi:hypothetical protein